VALQSESASCNFMSRAEHHYASRNLSTGSGQVHAGCMFLTIAPSPTCRGPFRTCRIQMCWFGAWRTSGDPWTGIAASRAPPKVLLSQIVPGLGILFAKSPGTCTTRRVCSLQLGSSRTRSCNLETFAWPQCCVVYDRRKPPGERHPAGQRVDRRAAGAGRGRGPDAAPVRARPHAVSIIFFEIYSLPCEPALGVEGDPMRLLFERDLTP